MGLRLFSTSFLDPSGQFSPARVIKDPESLGQRSTLASKGLDHLSHTHPKPSTQPTHPCHYHEQIYQDLETNTSLRSRHSRSSSDRRERCGRIVAADGYGNGSQDRQSTQPIRSHSSRSSRRPPSLKRQDAFADTRTRKDRQIQRRGLVSSGRTFHLRHHLRGISTHRLLIISGIMVLQEEAMLPRWLDVGATQPLWKRRRGGITEEYAEECDVKRRKRRGVRNHGNPEQPSNCWSACGTAEDSN